MDWKLELIVVPSADVDRSKAFYMEQVGFELHVDHSAGEDFRVVQLNPPGSACSIAVMKQPDRAGVVQGLHLIVTDVDAAREELLQRGVSVSELFHFGERGQTPGPDPQRRDYNSFRQLRRPRRKRLAGAGGQGRLSGRSSAGQAACSPASVRASCAASGVLTSTLRNGSLLRTENASAGTPRRTTNARSRRIVRAT